MSSTTSECRPWVRQPGPTEAHSDGAILIRPTSCALARGPTGWARRVSKEHPWQHMQARRRNAPVISAVRNADKPLTSGTARRSPSARTAGMTRTVRARTNQATSRARASPTTKPMTTQDRQPAWWLQGGDEECPHCGQPYHLESERRCPGCDAPGCHHCLGDPKAHCPDCVAPPQQ